MHAAKLSACVAFLPEINPSLGSHELPELQILDFPCKKMNLRARRAYRVPRFNSNNSEQTGVFRWASGGDMDESTSRLRTQSRVPCPALSSRDRTPKTSA